MDTRRNKRIIVCCDGTWDSADSGYSKPSFIPWRPYGLLQIPSNVVRIGRAIRHYDRYGTQQIIYYQSGIGTVGGLEAKLLGGLMGTGISENIREAYAFITTNYVPGDEIIIIGFSRGAYTARSIGGFINDVGLLNREGMEYFYAIFKDNENAYDENYKDIFPDVPFSNKPTGPGNFKIQEYKKRLVEEGFTRVSDPDGKLIQVHAIAVWDTVGSLGIPKFGQDIIPHMMDRPDPADENSASWMQKFGFSFASHELRWHNTNISNTVRHAFQALALDEERAPFTPTIWERDSEKITTDLRQCWFPGAHGNIGGGYDDQEVANVSLCWMMDQLASVGIEFDETYIDYVFEENRRYFLHQQNSHTLIPHEAKPWAVSNIYQTYDPVRPYALGLIKHSVTGMYLITGKTERTPGQYRRMDPKNGYPNGPRMTRTNERVHSSVRVRMELGGLDKDDKGPYKGEALKSWRLKQMRIKVHDPIGPEADWAGIPNQAAQYQPRDVRWVWEWVGPNDENAPLEPIMIEECPGPFEARLIELNSGISQTIALLAETKISNRDLLQ